MTTINPVAGALPQQPAAASGCAAPPPTLAATPAPTTNSTAALSAAPAAAGVAPATTVAGGGLVQAAQGAQAALPATLVPLLQQLVDVLSQLVAVLQQQGVLGGGGSAGAAVGQCGMSGCTMDHSAGSAPASDAATGAGAAGASGAPTAPAPARGANANPAPSQPSPAGRVDPASVKDKTSANGLTEASRKGLEIAHSYGLPLVSGKRDGDSSKSEHPSGRAIDVSTLAINSADSTGGTPDMKAYAEHMRQEGKAGRLNVMYIIRDGQIASATNNWEWRAYTYPGESTSSLEKMKSSDRANYNRIQHYDHVHVSFN